MKKLSHLDARIPNWNFDELEERYCPFCNSMDHKNSFIRPDGLDVQFCKYCNTFFISPTPSDEQLTSFYSNYEDNHGRESIVSYKELLNKYEKIDPLSDVRIKELISFFPNSSPKVLDVGFGKAQFLFLLKKIGFVTHGVDLDKKAIEIANYLGIDHVYSGTLKEVPSDFKYNVIVLNDLIEHPLNPMSLLETACELLLDNGLLLIWTPNGDISHREEDPITFRVDLEHMQYLSPDTCVHIASKLNMRIVHLETLGFPWLDGIDGILNKKESSINKIKRAIKLVPGFQIINNIRAKLTGNTSKDNERLGQYHLFCILQKKILC